MENPRLDIVLWSLRLYKTRALAAEACRSGRVAVGGREARAGRDVRAGEIVTVRLDGLTKTIEILGIPRSRVGAKQLPEFMRDLTPPEEYERARAARPTPLGQRVGARPTKRNRRILSRFFGTE